DDGIRDFHVTGVQTCPLPIWLADGFGAGRSPTRVYEPCSHGCTHTIHPMVVVPRFPCGIRRVRTEPTSVTAGTTALRYRTLIDRSEERRAGKEGEPPGAIAYR